MSGHSRKAGHHRTKATSGSRIKLHQAPAAESVCRSTESGGTPLYAPVLVLNASYGPINICAARRALVLVLKGVAMTEEENGHYLHAQRIAMRLPSVIRLLEYRRIPHQTRALSRKNILLRDRNTCAYCAVIISSGELTLFEVVRKCRGGLSTWQNHFAF